MGKGILRDLKQAGKNVAAEISANASSGGRFAGALSAEGFAGGYQAALHDVEAALRGNPRPFSSRFWPPHD